jgi:hypothetical protein
MRKMFAASAVLTLSIAISACGPRVERIKMASVTPAEEQAAIRVRIFPVGSTYPEVIRHLGPISAFSCKNKVWDKPASTGDAFAQLRLKALRMGANAVIDVTSDTRGTDTWGTNCWESVQAEGTAVVVKANP